MPTLGDRMKSYEHVYRHYLPKRTYTLMRLDGRAFHTYTRDLKKPFDSAMTFAMLVTTRVLCEEITGTVFAYTQSDEISLLITDFANHDTQPWMGGNIAKMLSLSASCATAEFNRHNVVDGERAMFDSRIWTMSDANEVMNYFLWRQRDAEKNAISATAQAHFSPKELEGKNSAQRVQMLKDEHNVDFVRDIGYGHRRGFMIVKEQYEVGPENALRTQWTTIDAPKFEIIPNAWWVRMVPKLPTLP